ncbi:ATP-binding cassette domain-containing protein [Xinfangfangia sp. D13-10-4-6]|nr:ATP-binding cassette domain-containing protein [Pseudogemmobacter hezensis]NPD16827.1 ATP-binding cassette domain-containing protein [Pseudogemmobacter hezensis]
MLPGAASLRIAAALSCGQALLWPLQAGLVALAFAQLLAGGGISWLYVPGFLALGLLRIGLGWAGERAAEAAALNVIATARARILAREARRAGHGASGGAFAGAGALASLAGDKLERLGAFTLRYAPARARMMVMPLVILLIALWFSWAVALIFLISGPLIPVFMALVGMAARDASAAQLNQLGSMSEALVERLAALADIRLLGASGRVADDFATGAEGLRKGSMKVLAIAFLSSTVLELFSAIGVAMVAVWVGFSLLGQIGFGSWGEGQISPAAGMFLLLLAPDFYQPMRDLAAAWHDRADAEAVAAELALAETDEGPAIMGQGARVAPLPGPATLSLRGGVTPQGAALPDIGIRAGEKVALVGPSGAGKTTILRQLAGLDPIALGEVLVAGQRLNDATADAWRARIGWMPQAVHFTNESLAANLHLGREGDPWPALRLAAADQVVAGLPDGLLTRPGENGAGLSGGEARRLTLARALFGAPDVILADEPTADLDAETADAVTKGLLAAAGPHVTLVVATHDAGLAARMDRIIRIGGAA